MVTELESDGERLQQGRGWISCLIMQHLSFLLADGQAALSAGAVQTVNGKFECFMLVSAET